MTFLKQFFQRFRHLFLYSVLMAIMVFALKWIQWKYLVTDNSSDIYNGLTAVLFTILGIWIATQLTRPKIHTVVVEKPVYINTPVTDKIDEGELKKLHLTNREYEVLQLLTQGHSNAEIAENLFLSLSTIKTHVSNLLLKLDVKNRTQAVQKAKRLNITL